jgi:hypothetical protein
MSEAALSAPAQSSAPIESTQAPMDVQGNPMPYAASGSSAPADPAAAAAKAAPAEKLMAAAKKQYKIKVDNHEQSVDFDPSNEEEIRKHLQLSTVAQKRMQESAEVRKGVQELLDTLRTNPLKVIMDPRLNISEAERHKLAESLMNEQIQEMAKTPEVRERERLQREYERLQQEVKTERQAREQAENMRLQEQAAVQYDTDISSAIESSGMPRTARTVKYFAEALKFCVQNDLNLSAKDLVPYVKKQALSEFREVMTGLSDDDFENWLGKDGLSRIRKRNLAKAKAVTSPSEIKSTTAESNSKAQKEDKSKISYKDFFKSF